VRFEALQATRRAARERGLILRLWCADLEQQPLPRERFEVIVVTRYLQRNLFASLESALVPEGVLLYETFTEAQRAHGWGPTAAEHLLRPGELRTAFPSLAVTFYEEVSGPDAVARLVATRPA
jgi:hypothetical protein